MKIPPSVREYPCFKTDSKKSQAAQCAKSISLSKVVDTILNIGYFE